MQPDVDTRSYVRSALFVDFDNIYSNLEKLDPRYAELFSNKPQRWLNWFEQGRHALTSSTEPVFRRLLVKRCYLNPSLYSRQRINFVQSGFSVIDCPSLTRQNKNSADIFIAVDILDLISHTTHFDEFLLLSSDADFTPILTRLRMNDRRTAILVPEFSASAYRASCDNVILLQNFVDNTLRITTELSAAGAINSDDFITSLSRAITNEITTYGELPFSDLSKIFRNFPSFFDTHADYRGKWFGCGTLNRLAEEICNKNSQLMIREGPSNFDGFSTRYLFLSEAPIGAVQGTSDLMDKIPLSTAAINNTEIIDICAKQITKILLDENNPLDMAKIASVLHKMTNGQLRLSNYAGYGSFKKMLTELKLPKIGIINVQPGFLYHTDRYTPDYGLEDDYEDYFAKLPPELMAFIERIVDLTDIPSLAPIEYNALFRMMAEHYVSHEDRGIVCKHIHTKLLDQKMDISLKDITFVMSGFIHHDVQIQACNTDGLAREWIRCVESLCESAQLDLYENEKKLLRRWLAYNALDDAESA